MRHQQLRPVLTITGKRRHLASLPDLFFPTKTLCGVIAVRACPDGHAITMIGTLRHPDCKHCAGLL